MVLNRGYIHIITGNGPGKTTSAFGLGFRAAGHGLKVHIIQFLKSGWHGTQYGEVKTASKIKNIIVSQFGSGKFFRLKDEKIIEKDLEIVQKGFEFSKKVINGGNFDLVVLDEILVAVYFGLIKISSVIDLLKNKPSNVELVLTGRYAPKKLFRFADYISEIKEIKHPYPKKEKGRIGIEI